MTIDEKRKEIDNTFDYHAPNEGQKKKYKELSEKAKELAHLILDLTPISREQSLALTHLDDVRHYMNAAIARHGN